MVYLDSGHTTAIQPIRIKSSGTPLYELVCDHDKSSSPTIARNLTYEGKTLKAVFSVAAVKMTTATPSSSDNYGFMDTTSSGTGARSFMSSKNKITKVRDYNGGLSGYTIYSASSTTGSYMYPSSIKNTSSSTWYVVVAALNPGGEGDASTLQMGIFTGMSSPNGIPSSSPTRKTFNQAVEGFPCRTATYKFTCAGGKGFQAPGINWSSLFPQGSGVWFGNILIGIST